MTSSKYSSIYFLTPSESKIFGYCEICNKAVEGIAVIPDLEMKLTTVVLKCHKKTHGIRVTDELLSSNRIRGFALDKDEKVKPVERVTKYDPMVTVYTMRLESAIREAKEKVYKKIYGNGQWVSPDKFGVVRKSMINPEAIEEVTEEEYDKDLLTRRRIILED